MVGSLWFKWKAINFPWRKTILVGQDLAGNTFWIFKDALRAGRYRRIVKFDPKTHYGDVKVTPQWHQWLRHLREDPPTIEEQRQDLIRQAQMKQLARLADERWASKSSFLDKPKTDQPTSAVESGAVNSTSNSASPPAESKVPDASKNEQKQNPWAKSDGRVPGEGWQPESWTPNSHR
ncbi:hypothetical protein N7495_003680 [Penicillium taxi]|uniref:uncharacterized protein n=1 Tax=Penicillium taxi TaxID=168475 RepID=UPI002545501E|nr:uncharacterized protein N7495_003680 [Penicillium taxi]KAJ5898936.1 hypothetical protein N7495_003680 [Penicillium taxi]